MHPGVGASPTNTTQSQRRFNELLEALRHEHDLALAAGASSALPSVALPPDPTLMAEVAVINKTLRDMDLAVQNRNKAHDDEVKRLQSLLQAHGIDYASPVLPSKLPPAVDSELSAGTLTAAFSGDKSPGGGPHSGDAQRPEAPKTTPAHSTNLVAAWSAVPASSESVLSVELLNTISAESVICSVAFSHDGKYVALGVNRAVLVFEAFGAGRRVAVLRDSVDRDGDLYIRCVSWSADDQLLAAGAEDHFVRVWTVATGKLKHRLTGHSQEVYAVSFLPSARLLASAGGDRTVRLWDVPSGECRACLALKDGPSSDAAHGFTSLSCSESLIVAVVQSPDSAVHSDLGWTLEGHSDAVYSVALFKTHNHVVSAGLDKSVRVWRFDPVAQTYALHQTLAAHRDFCLSVSLSGDERIAVSTSKDRSVNVYTVDGLHFALQLTLQGHRNSVTSSSFCPQVVPGEHSNAVVLATGAGDCKARIWRLNSA